MSDSFPTTNLFSLRTRRRPPARVGRERHHKGDFRFHRLGDAEVAIAATRPSHDDLVPSQLTLVFYKISAVDLKAGQWGDARIEGFPRPNGEYPRGCVIRVRTDEGVRIFKVRRAGARRTIARGSHGVITLTPYVAVNGRKTAKAIRVRHSALDGSRTTVFESHVPNKSGGFSSILRDRFADSAERFEIWIDDEPRKPGPFSSWTAFKETFFPTSTAADSRQER